MIALFIREAAKALSREAAAAFSCGRKPADPDGPPPARPAAKRRQQTDAAAASRLPNAWTHLSVG